MKSLEEIKQIIEKQKNQKYDKNREGITTFGEVIKKQLQKQSEQKEAR